MQPREIRQLSDGAINANNDCAQTGVDAALMTTSWSRRIGRQLPFGIIRTSRHVTKTPDQGP
jgi:hypothetical protein